MLGAACRRDSNAACIMQSQGQWAALITANLLPRPVLQLLSGTCAHPAAAALTRQAPDVCISDEGVHHHLSRPAGARGGGGGQGVGPREKGGRARAWGLGNQRHACMAAVTGMRVHTRTQGACRGGRQATGTCASLHP